MLHLDRRQFTILIGEISSGDIPVPAPLPNTHRSCSAYRKRHPESTDRPRNFRKIDPFRIYTQFCRNIFNAEYGKFQLSGVFDLYYTLKKQLYSYSKTEKPILPIPESGSSYSKPPYLKLSNLSLSLFYYYAFLQHDIRI